MTTLRLIATNLFRPLLLSLVALSLVSAAASEQVLRGFFLHEHPSSKSADVVIIENSEQMAEFLRSLPENVPSMKQPAPANPDPLRKGLVIDFERNLLVVALHRDTISAYPVFQSFQRGLVKFDVPSPPAEARPYGWGVYTAVVLPRSEVEVKVELTPVENDW